MVRGGKAPKISPLTPLPRLTPTPKKSCSSPPPQKKKKNKKERERERHAKKFFRVFSMDMSSLLSSSLPFFLCFPFFSLSFSSFHLSCFPFPLFFFFLLLLSFPFLCLSSLMIFPPRSAIFPPENVQRETCPHPLPGCYATAGEGSMFPMTKDVENSIWKVATYSKICNYLSKTIYTTSIFRLDTAKTGVCT